MDIIEYVSSNVGHLARKCVCYPYIFHILFNLNIMYNSLRRCFGCSFLLSSSCIFFRSNWRSKPRFIYWDSWKTMNSKYKTYWVTYQIYSQLLLFDTRIYVDIQKSERNKHRMKRNNRSLHWIPANLWSLIFASKSKYIFLGTNFLSIPT